VDGRHHVIFERLSRTQPWNGNVFLAIVGVDGRFFFEGNAQVLHRFGSRGYGASVRFQHPHVRNFNPLVGGTVSDYKLAPLFHAGFALDLDSGGEFAFASPIAFKAVGRAHLFHHKSLLRIIRSGFRCFL
jgi:hypothetical protein